MNNGFQITESDYLTAKQIVIQYEKDKNKTEHWKPLVDTWFRYYHSKKGTDPTFTNGEQPALKRLMTKIKTKATGANIQWDEGSATGCLEIFLVKITDRWTLQNLSLRIIDSHFDKLYSFAHGKSPASQNAELDAQITARIGK